MLAKKQPGSPDVDPDDAPELTADMLDRAEVFDGDTFVRRGRGRPPLDDPKEKINIRLDAAVLEQARASGPGWQTRINTLMARSSDRQIWNANEACIVNNERQIEDLTASIHEMEAGIGRPFINNEDATASRTLQYKKAVEALTEANRMMRKTQTDLLELFLPTEEDRSPSAD